MRPSILAATLAVLALAGTAARAEVLVVVDKSTQRMTVTVDGVERHAWPVSTGTADHATPAGSFAPLRLARTHFSREWDDAPMPHSIFFTERGHAIHGSGAVGRLGSPASHGCVRLAPGPAGVLFRLVASRALDQVRIEIRGAEPLGYASGAAGTPGDYGRLTSFDPLVAGIMAEARPARRR